MDASGEVADLMVKESLQAGETAVKLAAGGVKHVTALLLALSQSDRKIIGKTSIRKLTKDPTPALVLPLRNEDVGRFRKLAKEYGILYVIARPKGRTGETVDVISNERYAAKLNALFQAMGYPLPEKPAPEEPVKKGTSRAPQERSSPEHGNGWRAQTRTDKEEKPSVRARLAALREAAKGLEPMAPSRDTGHIR